MTLGGTASSLRRYLALLSCSLIIALCGRITLAVSAASEQALTVAFLYNFIKLSEWPENPKDTGELTLCLSRQADINQEIQALADKQVLGKKILIKHLEQDTHPINCQLLFLSRTDNEEQVTAWIKSANHSATLLVGNVDGLLDLGGMIAIFNDDERLQFDVNLEPVKRAKIKLSSEMLKIARTVKGN